LTTVTRSGRHRYYTLSSDEVARALEALQGLAPARPVRSLRDARTGSALTFARHCYDHLAGQLAIQVTTALTRTGALAPLAAAEKGTLLDPAHPFLAQLGLDIPVRNASRRPMATGVLKLCKEAGLVKVSVIAIDGTKISANAGRDANKSYRRIVHEILEEAEETDRAEDEQHGDRRGDELPEEMHTEECRRAAFRAAKRRLVRRSDGDRDRESKHGRDGGSDPADGEGSPQAADAGVRC